MFGASKPIPTDVVYSLLLLGHVVTAVVGFGALAVTGAQAGRARRGPQAPAAGAVRRYFRPGVNWAGRLVYLVPVLGFAVVAASRGSVEPSDSFVLAGLALWLVTLATAEAVVWPAERRIQQIVSGQWPDEAGGPDLDRDCRAAQSGAIFTSVLFVAAAVLMVGRP
ncbi:MAG: DUF2269 family protein [Acidimicrobiales bacterium]